MEVEEHPDAITKVRLNLFVSRRSRFHFVAIPEQFLDFRMRSIQGFLRTLHGGNAVQRPQPKRCPNKK
jgi:hypothetical protein